MDWQTPDPAHFGNVIAPPAPVVPVVVQLRHHGVFTNSTSISTTLFGTGTGNDIVVFLLTSADSAPQSVVSVSDNVNGAYTHVPNTFQVVGSLTKCSQDIWRFHAGFGGDLTVTVEVAVLTEELQIWVYEVSGLSGAVDSSGGAVAIGNYSASLVGSAGDFYVAAVRDPDEGLDGTVGSPWTAVIQSNVDFVLAYLIGSGNQVVTFGAPSPSPADTAISYAALAAA